MGSPLRRPWIVATVEAYAQDVRHALRLMRRDPVFTFTALATLALGIGFNTAIFSVTYGVLWRPLPYPDADRLVIVSSRFAHCRRNEVDRTSWSLAAQVGITYAVLLASSSYR